MKKFLAGLLIVVFIASSVFFIWLFTLDGSYLIKRTVIIEKPVASVWPLVANYTNWTKWSPWYCLDSKTKATFSKDCCKVGSVFKWESELAGSGQLEHRRIVLDTLIEDNLRFEKPLTYQSNFFWKFEKRDSFSVVTWEMRGEMPFFSRFMAKKLEPMIARDFERGLKMLKDFAEIGVVSSKVDVIGIVKAPEVTYIGKNAICNMGDMQNVMKQHFFSLLAMSIQHNMVPEKAISVYHTLDFQNGISSFTSGFVAPGVKKIKAKGFDYSTIPATKAVKVMYKGSFSYLENAWAAAYNYVRAKDLTLNSEIHPYALYLSNPLKIVNPSDFQSEIYIPVK
jgi:effector-binding domain-containing protein